MGFFQATVLEWGAIAFSVTLALRLSLNSSVKVGILLLLLTIEKSFFSPLSKMLGLSFLEMTFVRLKKVSSTLCCFYQELQDFDNFYYNFWYNMVKY